jgi:hypothetical protein
MSMYLDTMKVINGTDENFLLEPSFNLRLLATLCEAGMKAALRDNDLRMYFTFSIKCEAYKKALWAYYSLYMHRRRKLSPWEEEILFPKESDSMEELECSFTCKFPGQARG